MIAAGPKTQTATTCVELQGILCSIRSAQRKEKEDFDYMTLAATSPLARASNRKPEESCIFRAVLLDPDWPGWRKDGRQPGFPNLNARRKGMVASLLRLFGPIELQDTASLEEKETMTKSKTRVQSRCILDLFICLLGSSTQGSGAC